MAIFEGPGAALRQWYKVRRSLARLRPLLQPGSYRIYGSVALTPSVSGVRLDDYQRALKEGNAGSSPLTRLLQKFPSRIPDQPRGDGPRYDTLILRRDWVILVEAGRDHVLRLTSRPELGQRLVNNAAWLRRSYPVPWVETVPVGLKGLYGVKEGFVAGRPIRSAAPELWDPVFRELLAACCNHAALCEGHFDYSAITAELPAWRLPDWLERALAGHDEAIRALLEDCPLLAGHGDCHNGNVVVQPDGRLILIDLERVQPLPFFFDALSLPRGSGQVNSFLRRAYLAGEYDRELTAIWAAAGRQWQPRWRVPALLAMTLAHAFRPQFSASGSARRREKLIGAAEKIRRDCNLD